MTRALLAAAALVSCAALSACFAPRPCTMALCPSKVEGTYRVSGWTGSAAVSAGSPTVPVVPDSTVEVTDGSVEFVNGKTAVRAQAGAKFTFRIAQTKRHEPLLDVASGPVAVSASSQPAVAVPAGAPYALPIPK